jgi:hypothetical protein
MKGAQKLADFPGRKIKVECERCGLRKQFDKAAMIVAGGADRPPTLLIDEIARRSGCTLVDDPGPTAYDIARCAIPNSPNYWLKRPKFG